MSVTEVWGEGRFALWTPQGPVTIPDGYAYLPSGDGPLTRAVRKASKELPLYAVMKRRSKRYRPQQIGLWAPAAVVEAERERLAAMRTPDHADRLLAEKRRRQERDIRAFAEEIRGRFPGCPADEAREIAGHACVIGSGRVGRSSTAEDPVRAAVVAHVRHCHTDYEELLEQAREWCFDGDDLRRARAEARAEVRDRIDEILSRWEERPDVPAKAGIADRDSCSESLNHERELRRERQVAEADRRAETPSGGVDLRLQ